MKKYVAEFIGTAVLVLFGCGTAAVLGTKGSEANVAYLATAFAFGLSIVAMAYAIGKSAGWHINPAVSIGFLLSGKMNVKDFIGYVIAQFLGGICGAFILMSLIGKEHGLGTNGLFDASIGKSLLIEIILTFVFVFVILGVTSKISNSAIAGLVIGLSLTLIHIFGIHFTGTSCKSSKKFRTSIIHGWRIFNISMGIYHSPSNRWCLSCIMLQMVIYRN